MTPLGAFDSVYGYTAIHPPSSSLVISFRGTRNLDNWIHNLLIAKPDAPFPDAPEGAKVHYGFLKDYLIVRQDLLTAYAAARLDFPEYQIHFVGHSLGGALAILASVDLFTLGVLVSFLTF